MPVVPASFDADGTIGALMIGVLISCFLFGIVTTQTYTYYSRFPDDKLKLKLLVSIVWIFECAHCATICHTLYALAVANYGNPRALVKPPNSLFLSIVFSGFIGPLVQAFFADRVRIIGKQLVIPIICWVLSAARLAMSFVAAGEAFAMRTLTEYQHDFRWLLTTILSIGAAVDIIIAATLIFYLHRSKNQSHEQTALVIDKIIAWTIQTGLATSLTGIVMLVCFLTMHGNFVWLAFFMFLARMFSNSLLASLNGRTELRNSRYTNTGITSTSIRVGRFTEVSTSSAIQYPDALEMKQGRSQFA